MAMARSKRERTSTCVPRVVTSTKAGNPPAASTSSEEPGQPERRPVTRMSDPLASHFAAPRESGEQGAPFRLRAEWLRVQREGSAINSRAAASALRGSDSWPTGGVDWAPRGGALSVFCR
jgi:hypothetical protein